MCFSARVGRYPSLEGLALGEGGLARNAHGPERGADGGGTFVYLHLWTYSGSFVNSVG